VNITIINGFDRSGTSFIAGLLDKHSEVAYYCQPDNKTRLETFRWDYWKTGEADAASYAFIEKLCAGQLDEEFIAGSEWFGTCGTSSTILAADKINLWKSTKLHLKVKWLAQFPAISFFAVIRDPRAIIASLVRNGFHESWYSRDDYARILQTFRDESMPEIDWLPSVAAQAGFNPVQQVCMLTVLNTMYMCRDLGWARERIIYYEQVLANPSCLAGYFALAPIDYAAELGQDYNMVGKKFISADYGWQNLSKETKEQINDLVQPLCRCLGYGERVGEFSIKKDNTLEG